MVIDPDEFAGEWAKRVIRAEMARRSLTYRELGERLDRVDAGENDERVLRNKVARGTFSAGFFIQCLTAMGCTTLNIDFLEAWREAKYESELDEEEKQAQDGGG